MKLSEGLPLPTPVRPQDAPLGKALAGWYAAMQPTGIAAVCIQLPDGSVPASPTLAAQTLQVSWPPGMRAPLARTRACDEFRSPPSEQLLELGSIAPDSLHAPWWRAGMRSYARISLPVPAYQCVDLIGLSEHTADRLSIDAVAAICLRWWPELRRGLQAEISDLRTHEVKCLAFAFAGLTARETADRMCVSERTVNAYLQTAMAKLGVSSKLAAVQLACWLGHF